MHHQARRASGSVIRKIPSIHLGGSAAPIAAALLALAAIPALPLAAASPGPGASPMPTVEPVDAEGLKRAIESARGKVVVLNFWATWCDPCREEFPDVVRVASEFPNDVALITVSLDDTDFVDSQVRPFLQKVRAPGRALIKGPGDPDAFINSVDPKWSGGLPATFIHAPDGRRAHAIHGPTTYAALKALVTPLLPPDAPAR
jgi:thiol-disulfide isomerase/thioredoxin